MDFKTKLEKLIKAELKKTDRPFYAQKNTVVALLENAAGSVRAGEFDEGRK